MERRKNEIHTNFNRLKEECGSLVLVLNSLLEQRMKSMRMIDEMTPDEILRNPQFFINESKRQYESIQKVLTLNLDLESFIALEDSFYSPSSTPTKDHFSSQLSLNIDSDESSYKTTIYKNDPINLKKEEQNLLTQLNVEGEKTVNKNEGVTVVNKNDGITSVGKYEGITPVNKNEEITSLDKNKGNKNDQITSLVKNEALKSVNKNEEITSLVKNEAITSVNTNEEFRAENQNDEINQMEQEAELDYKHSISREMNNSPPPQKGTYTKPAEKLRSYATTRDIVNYGIDESSESSDFPDDIIEKNKPRHLHSKAHTPDPGKRNNRSKSISEENKPRKSPSTKLHQSTKKVPISPKHSSDNSKEATTVKNTKSRPDNSKEATTVKNTKSRPDSPKHSSEDTTEENKHSSGDTTEKNKPSVKAGKRGHTPDSGKHSSRSRRSSNLISDSSESSETMMDKMSKRKLMSRQQRYLNDLKKPPMPDLSFQVVPNQTPRNSSTEFCSATDSENDFHTDTDTTYKESFDYSVIKKSYPLELNDKCMITHIISPSEFYVTKLVEDHDQFQQMVEKLTQFGKYFKAFSSKAEAKQNINKYCMAYSDIWESWNRTEVLDWNINRNPQSADVKVQFVDYGDYEIVPYSNLRILPHELCEKPKLAIKCHLAYLFAPNSTPSNLSLQWPESSINAAKELIETTNTIYNIIYLENFGYSYGIDLEKDGGSDVDSTVGEILLKSKHAVEITENFDIIQNSFMKQQLISVQGMSGVEAHMSEKEVMDKFCDNVEITESNRLEEAFTGYVAQDEARTCRHAKNGTCYKGINCKLDHEPLNPDGTTTDKLLTYIDALDPLPTPEIGQNLTILITSVCTVNSFYGHIMSYNAEGEVIRSLSKALNAPNVQHPPLKVLPAIGEIVIAKYCDDKWYRAKASDVISGHEGSDLMVKVFFVDFGDVMDVNLKDLRQISEKYLHVPFQAVRFNIHNIIPRRDSDKNKAVEYFQQVYLYKKFNAEVLRVLSSFIEVLLTNSNNEDIGAQLIDMGYAEPKIVSLLPLENGRFLVD